MITQWVVNYASQECYWQHSGELSVAWMMAGWMYAHRRRNKRITMKHVLDLGRLVEPRKNQNGLREVNVRVGRDEKMHWSLVPAAIDQLVTQLDVDSEEWLGVNPDEWFREYEEIHPFRDGNGRTGSLLYNWLRGSLDAPIHPPNFWGDARRDYRGYPIPNAGLQ